MTPTPSPEMLERARAFFEDPALLPLQDEYAPILARLLDTVRREQQERDVALVSECPEMYKRRDLITSWIAQAIREGK